MSKLRTADSTCILCGCGCRLRYFLDDEGNITRCKPIIIDRERGYEGCFKGFIAWKGVETNRIDRPYVRGEDGELKESTWKEVYEILNSVFRDYKEENIAYVASGEVTNENNYIIQKFARVISFTNNIDTCARLCHASTLDAMMKTLGISVMPNKIDDVLSADCILVFGSNPYTNYPALGTKLMLAKMKGCKIISVQGSVNETSRKLADIVVTLEPGTEIIFINTLVAELVRKKYIPLSRIEELKGGEAFLNVIEKFKSSLVYRFCHIDLEVFDKIVETIGKTENFVVMHGMGITQSGIGTETVACLINLVLLKDAKLVSMRGKINIQGAGDMGCSPTSYPTGPINEETKMKYESIIGAEVPLMEGLTQIEFMLTSPVDVIYICGSNPAVSMPYLDAIHRVLKRAFVIYHHPFWTRTAKFADIILPLPTLIETNGTITNAEALVRRVRKVREVISSAREPWQFLGQLAKRMGYEHQFIYRDPFDIFEEICRAQPRYRILNIKEVWNGRETYTDKTPKFRRLHIPKIPSRPIKRSLQYPFILLTMRSPYHFCAGDVTRNIDGLLKNESEAYLFMNPRDMNDLGLENRDLVEVTSRCGRIKIKVKMSESIPPGIVATRFHFESTLVNRLTPPEFDPESLTPNYKDIPVNIRKLAE